MTKPTTRSPRAKAVLVPPLSSNDSFGPKGSGFASPMKVPKTGELVARRLRNLIIRGELAEGSTLPPESELMGQFAISRPTLREALRILESESLLEVRRGSRGGPIVRKPDPNVAARYFGLVLQAQGTTLADVYYARMLLERPALRLVIEKARDTAPAILRAIVEDQISALAEGNIPLLAHHFARFHETLVVLAGNETLVLVMRLLTEIFEQHISSAQLTAGPNFDRIGESQRAVKAQTKLISLIEAGDVMAALDYWRSHLINAGKVLFQNAAGSKVIDILT